MKKIVLALTMLFLATGALFAQSDLQVLAVVKLTKNESITLKQVKSRSEIYRKQLNRTITIDERKMIVDTLIEEKLMLQAAQKANIAIPDSYVDQYFLAGISQSIGANVTEKELIELVKKTQNKTLDEFLIAQVGMNVADYKAYLKNSLIIQQYVVQQKQAELQKVAPTDEEIRLAYESNKSSFVWNDMIKVFMVLVPKNGKPDDAKLKLNDLLNKYKDKKLTAEQISVQSQVEGSGYQAGEMLLPKNEAAANGIGMSLQNLIFVFNQNEGFVSDLQETEQDYRFISVIKKYQAKMLGIGDIVQPDTTITVYDYIKNNLTQQKQQAYVTNAAQEISKSLNTAENVELKKTGVALEKLLDWGE